MGNNITNNLNKIKQPEPSIKDENEKRSFKVPYAGVLSIPKISTLPVLDEYIRSANENPQIKYSLSSKKVRFFDFQNIVSTAIIGLSAVSLFNVLKTIFKK